MPYEVQFHTRSGWKKWYPLSSEDGEGSHKDSWFFKANAQEARARAKRYHPRMRFRVVPSRR